MWTLKYDTNELIYEIETDSQIKRTDLWLPRGKECRVFIHIRWINNKVALYSTGNNIQ